MINTKQDVFIVLLYNKTTSAPITIGCNIVNVIITAHEIRTHRGFDFKNGDLIKIFMLQERKIATPADYSEIHNGESVDGLKQICSLKKSDCGWEEIWHHDFLQKFYESYK